MTIHDARVELAALGGGGELGADGVAFFAEYVTAPAAATVIVGLPRRIEPGSLGLDVVELPFECFVLGRGELAERLLIELAQDVRRAFHGLPAGDHFRSIRFVEISDVGAVRVGASDVLGASVIFSLHIPTA